MNGDPRYEVAVASRVLYRNGVVDAFGHVSRRHPERDDAFLMSRSMAPALVQTEDVLIHDLDGDPIERPGERVFLERFLHAEIYRAHPGIHAIVHSHAPDVLPFTVVEEVPLRPLSHVCGFLCGVKAPFEIADHAGPGSDLLIRNAKLGAALAQYLDRAAIVLMRGHGFTAVGANIAEAVFRSIYTKFNCALQQSALALGQPRYLSDEEARACEEATRGQADRAWQLWMLEAEQNAPSLMPLSRRSTGP